MIAWLKANWEHLFAIAGMVYAIARTVIYMTPTHKDDELLEKAQPIIKAIAVALGLDPKQGLEKKN